MIINLNNTRVGYMKKIIIVLFIIVALAGYQVRAVDLFNLGYVVVSPNGPTDGGDYGPGTPGTQTSGIQEAFDYANQNTKEVYIVGGGQGNGGAPVVYNLSTTLTIPWGQDWHCDGGNYILNFTQTSGDCVVIDSQMSCNFRFGVISAPNLTSGSIFKINPATIGPDGFNVIEVTVFKVTRIVGNGSANVVGLHLAAVTAPNGNISDSKFLIGEISNCGTGILIEGTEGVNNNDLECPYVHACNNNLTVNSSSQNTVKVAMETDGVSGAIGANIAAGSQTTYTLTWLDDFDTGKGLMFGSSASDNIVYAANLPVEDITNNATNPTNRIVPREPVGFNITTPAVGSSGQYVKNTTGYSIVATILTTGSVSSWQVMDSSGTYRTVSGGLQAGQSIYLEPGDSVRFDYSSIPTWAWRAIR